MTWHSRLDRLDAPTKIEYRVRPIGQFRWNRWTRTEEVIQGFGWVEFDGKYFDSSYQFEVRYDY